MSGVEGKVRNLKQKKDRPCFVGFEDGRGHMRRKVGPSGRGGEKKGGKMDLRTSTYNYTGSW